MYKGYYALHFLGKKKRKYIVSTPAIPSFLHRALEDLLHDIKVVRWNADDLPL